MSLAAGPPAGRNPETGLWDVLLNLQAALPIRVSEGKLVYLFCEQIGQIGRSTYAYSITAWPVYRLTAAEDAGSGDIHGGNAYVHMLNSAMEFKGVVKLSRKRYPGNSHGGWTWRAWVFYETATNFRLSLPSTETIIGAGTIQWINISQMATPVLRKQCQPPLRSLPHLPRLRPNS